MSQNDQEEEEEEEEKEVKGKENVFVHKKHTYTQLFIGQSASFSISFQLFLPPS